MPVPTPDKLRECLLDLKNPIAQRTHAAFILRTKGDDESVQILAEALKNRQDSELMRHELAYILGQIGNPIVCPLLESILIDEDDDILVRHESAEALGAIGASDSISILQKYSIHSAPEISETCQIAIDLIQWRQSGESVGKSHYLSVDPAPALSNTAPNTSKNGVELVEEIEKLKNTLMDTSLSLFHRYRAMFSLRNIDNDASALALLHGFDDSSALFRHEIAYVLGQMQKPATIEGLAKVLRKTDEHRMVRHEAAEALGAIGGEEVEKVLNEYIDDEQIVVKESCHVALDTIEYWSAAEF